MFEKFNIMFCGGRTSKINNSSKKIAVKVSDGKKRFDVSKFYRSRPFSYRYLDRLGGRSLSANTGEIIVLFFIIINRLQKVGDDQRRVLLEMRSKSDP